MIVDFLSVKQLSNIFCEDEVLEVATCAVVLHEIGRNKKKRKKPRKKQVTKTRINQLLQISNFLLHTVLKVFGRLIVQCFEPFTNCTIRISFTFSTFSIMFLN
jgi:hypothetical protein